MCFIIVLFFFSTSVHLLYRRRSTRMRRLNSTHSLTRQINLDWFINLWTSVLLIYLERGKTVQSVMNLWNFYSVNFSLFSNTVLQGFLHRFFVSAVLFSFRINSVIIVIIPGQYLWCCHLRQNHMRDYVHWLHSCCLSKSYSALGSCQLVGQAANLIFESACMAAIDQTFTSRHLYY